MDAWSRIARASIAAPWRTLATAAVVLLILAPGLAHLTIRTDGLALVPHGTPAIETDRELRDRFGIEDQIAVVLETDDPRGIYNPTTLGRIVEISQRLASISELSGRVTSLATEGSDRVYTGSLTPRPWLDPLPATDGERERLRRDIAEAEVYGGTLVSSDPAVSAAAIVVDVERDADRAGLYRRIRDAVGPSVPGERVLVVGAPIAESQLGDHLVADLALLVPLSMAVMTAVFWLTFRCWALVLLPLAEVGIALVLTFALMGWCGVPVYLTMAVLPVILTMVGVTDELHLFAHLRRTLPPDAGGPQPAAIAATMDELAGPISKAALTTAAGFLSFAVSGIVPIRMFGIFMAAGVLVCMLVSLTCVPAVLAVLPAHRLHPRGRSLTLPTLRSLERFGRWTLDHRRRILAAGAVVLVVAPLGIRRLRVQDSWVGQFAPASEFRRASEEVDRVFGGTHILRIALERTAVAAAEGDIGRTAIDGSRLVLPGVLGEPGALAFRSVTLTLPTDRDPPPPWRGWIAATRVRDGTTELELAGRRGPTLTTWLPSRSPAVHYRLADDGSWLHPELLASAADLEHFLAGQPGVGRVLGPHGLLATMHYMLHQRRVGERRIPDDPELVERTIAHYQHVRGEQKLRALLDPTLGSALITVFLRGANFTDTSTLMDAVRDYERRELAPRGVQVRFAGDIAASQSMIEAIVGTQVWSVLLSLLGIVVVVAWLLGSPTWGLLCVLPASLGVLAMVAAMGFAGVPLGVATSMFAATVLCIGDDYAIHLAEATRRSLRAGQPRDAAIVDAVATVAPAIVVDALAVGAAFGVLCVSQVPTNARLGGLLVVSILVCVATTLLILPACLGMFRRLPAGVDTSTFRAGAGAAPNARPQVSRLHRLRSTD